MAKQDETYLTPGQVAKMLMVSPAALRIWAEKGEINALTTPGGHRRFLPDEVKRFADKRGLKSRSLKQNKLSILIVDDDIQFANYLYKLLKKHTEFLDVAVANDGFDAGIKVIEWKPDLILLDLMMPGLDGFDVCQRIKASSSTSDIRIIAMTGYRSTENVERILSLGAEVCMSKPLDKDELLLQIGIKEIINN